MDPLAIFLLWYLSSRTLLYLDTIEEWSKSELSENSKREEAALLIVLLVPIFPEIALPTVFFGRIWNLLVELNYCFLLTASTAYRMIPKKLFGVQSSEERDSSDKSRH